MNTTADTCAALLNDLGRAQARARRLETPQLVLIWGTVALVLLSVVLVIMEMQTLPIVTGALGLITGSAAAWVTNELNGAHKRADEKLKQYHSDCRDPQMLENLRSAL